MFISPSPQALACKVQPTTRIERTARSPAAKLGIPDANALRRSIERCLGGGKSATAGICDGLPDPDRRAAAKPKNKGPKFRKEPIYGYHDWLDIERQRTAAATPAYRDALSVLDVASIPTRRGHGTSHPETLSWWYPANPSYYGPDPFLREDIRRHYSPPAYAYANARETSTDDDVPDDDDLARHGLDTRSTADLMEAEEESFAGIAIALSGGSPWLTAGVFLAWLTGDVTPKALSRCKALPSDKTITAHLTAACERFAEWRQVGVVRAEQVAAGKGLLRHHSPLLGVLNAARRQKYARKRAHRMGQDVAKGVAIREQEAERQGALTPDERRQWLGENRYRNSAHRTSIQGPAWRLAQRQKQTDQRTREARAFMNMWMADHEHELPREIEPEKKFSKKPKITPLVAQI